LKRTGFSVEQDWVLEGHGTAALDPPTKTPATTGSSILWIDDDISDSAPEVIWLRRHGFEVVCALNGAVAKAMTRQRPFDVLMLYLKLPDGDGLTIFERLCRFDAAVVVLTGYADVDSAVRAFKMGVKDFLTKPIDVESLSTTVAQLISTPRSGPEVESQGDCLRVHCDSLKHCRTRLDLIQLMIAVLLDRHVTLRYFPECAAGLRLALKTVPTTGDTDSSLRTSADEIGAALRRALAQPWPSNHRLVEGFTRMAVKGRKESQEFIAGHFGLSRAHLSRIISRETQRPPSHWALFAAAVAAFRDVVESTEAISQIAYAHGWQHHSQFDDDFVRLFGASPTAVRHLTTRSVEQ
jgi:ActR/RegA family two-component response regulator/AraC-like DNA-binding protein